MKALFIILLSMSSGLIMGQMPPPDTVDLKELEVFSALKKVPAGMVQNNIDTNILFNESTVALSDLLDVHSSIFIKKEGRGALSTVSFRGTAASHTDVLWNGMSVKSPMLGQVDFSLFPVFLFDNISIMPGNSALSETTGALGGVVSLNNTGEWPEKLKIDLLTGYGSYNTFSNCLNVKFGTGRLSSATRLYYNYSENNFSFKNKNIANINPFTGEYEYPVQKNENADYMLSGIEQNFYYRTGKNGLLKADYWFQVSNRSLPRLNTYEGDDYSNVSRQDEKTHRVNLQYSFFEGDNKLLISSGLVYQKMNYNLKNFVGGQGYVYAVNSYSSVLSSYNKISYGFKPFKNSFLKAEYKFDFHNVSTIDSVKLTGYDVNRYEHKFSFAWNQKISNRFSVSMLIHKIWVEGKSIPLIPYVGYEWLVNGKRQFIIRGNIARNYNYPDLNDLYWQPGGNPNLKPEEGISGETSGSIVIKSGGIAFSPQLSVFYNNINNWILWLPAPAGYWQAQNVKKVVAKGLEFSFNLEFFIKNIKINTKGSYAYTLSLNYGDKTVWGDNAVGKQLPYIPVHSGNISVNLFWKTFAITYINNSYSERYTTSTNNVARRDWLYPYFMNNLYVSKYFTLKKSKITTQLKIYNLFNEEYRSVLGRPMPGINFMFSVKMSI